MADNSLKLDRELYRRIKGMDKNELTNSLEKYMLWALRTDDFSDEQLQAVVDLINNRPRKCLGFRSPAELLPNFL